MTKTGHKLLVFSVVSLFLLTSSSTAQPVHLDSGKFNPSQRDSDSFSTQSSSPSSRSMITSVTERENMIIQFSSNPSKELKKRLRKKGVVFHSYIPENAWIVTVNGGKGELRSRDDVTYLGKLRPEDKIGKHLEEKIGNLGGSIRVEVNFFQKKKGISPEKILSRSGTIQGKLGENTWKISTGKNGVETLSRGKSVKRISVTSPDPETHNADSRNLIGVSDLQGSENLNGTGFTAAVWDGGWAGQHSDLNYTGKRIIGDKGENCGTRCTVKDHATHVAGTMLGGGALDYMYRGMAPDARLVTYEWPANNITELRQETQESISSYDSVVSQNSWGVDVSSNPGLMGDYRSTAEGYDEVLANVTSIVDNPVPVVFSAGNEGGNHDTRYNTTTAAGATAKNTITVGAVDDNAEMTPYSSWGPTDDGRIKPDVVADGGIAVYGQAIRSTIPGNSYGGLQGTSMAAPAVSGSIILLTEKFNSTFGRLPEPDTTKGVLIHTAEDLNRTGPDYITGWGLVNSSDAASYIEKSSSDNLIRKGEIGQNSEDIYKVEMGSNESAKFTLVWDDHPGDTFSSKTLVNDLDLVVKDRSGVRKYPWTLDWSTRKDPASQDREDHRNNVEQVYVNSTEPGEYTVSVNTSSIPQPEQDYALMLPRTDGVTPPSLTVESPSNTSYSETPDFNITSDKDLENAVFSINGGRNRSMENSSQVSFYNTSTTLDSGSYSVKFLGTGKTGETGSSEVQFTVDSEAPDVTVESPLNNSNVQGSFEVAATSKDTPSGVKTREFRILNSSGVQKSGNLNSSIDSTTLADGDYSLIFNISDNLGNSRVLNYSITVANSEPVILDWEPLNQSTLSGTFPVEAVVTDDSGLKYSRFLLENGSGNRINRSLNGSIDSTGLEDGKYSLILRAEDTENHITSVNLEVDIDNSGPEITVYSPSNNSGISGDMSIYAGASDEGTIKDTGYQVGNQSGTYITGGFNESVNSSTLEDGDYNITFFAEDGTGNIEEKISRIEIDNTPPNLTKVEPSESFLNSIFTVEAVWSDELNDVDVRRYSVESSEGEEKSGDLNSSVDSTGLADGNYTVNYVVEDSLGNSLEKEKSVMIDNSLPQIGSETIESNSYVSGNVLVDAATSDEYSGVVDTGFNLSNNSGELSTGNLGTNLETDQYSDGNYTVEIFAEDKAGNTAKKSIQFYIDNTGPEIISAQPENLSNVSGEFEVKGLGRDNQSGIKTSNFSLNSSNRPISGDLNQSIDSTDLENGAYRIKFTTEDQAGNTGNLTREITVDNEKPEINLIKPSEKFQSELFQVEATWGDSITQVESAKYTFINRTETVKSGDLNSSINSSELVEGQYNLTLTASDSTGNTRITSKTVEIDRTPPVFTSITPENQSNISETVNISATVKNPENLDNTSYMVKNSSENITAWRNLSESFNSTDLADGDYNLSIKGVDKASNKAVDSTSVSVDNTDPEISVNISEYSGWAKDSLNAEVSCTDSSTGTERIYSYINGEPESNISETGKNYSLSRNGLNTYSFECIDFAGNRDTDSVELAIDSLEPGLNSTEPVNGSTTSRSFKLEIHFKNKTLRSGLNESYSNISTSKGSLENINWSNSSVSADIGSLIYSEDFSVELNIYDNVNHSSSSVLMYSVKEEPEKGTSSSSSDSGEDGGGSGGGFSMTQNNDSGKTENSSETTNSSLSGTEEEKNVRSFNVNLSSKPQEIDMRSENLPVETADVSGNGETIISISTIDNRENEDSEDSPENTEKYSELNITAENPEDLKMNMSFRVEKSWFRERDTSPNRTSLYRKNSSKWQKLETKMLEERANEYIFISEIPGFSRFIIASDRNTREENYTSRVMENSTCPEMEKCNTSTQNSVKNNSGTGDENILTWILSASSILIVLLLALYSGNSWRNKSQLKNEITEIRDLIDSNPKMESEIIEAELSIQNGDFSTAREKIDELSENL